MVATLSEMTKLWEKALKKIKTKLDDDRAYDSFFANAYIYDKNGSNVILVAPNKVSKLMIENKYLNLVLDALNELEDECIRLLGQANLTVAGFADKKYSFCAGIQAVANIHVASNTSSALIL